MKFHPYSEIFPLLSDQELQELADDIRQHGLREDIWTFGGMILDGRNRFLACQKANEKPRFRKFVGSEEGALALVISANIARRHLTASERAFAGARIAELRRGDNQHTARAASSSSQAEISEKIGTSPDSIQRAKKVIEKGSKALQKAAESGEVSLKKAAAVVDLPKSEQLAAAKAPDPEPEGSEPEVDEAERLAAALHEQDSAVERVLGSSGAEELKRQAAEIAALKTSRDGFMNGKAATEKLLAAANRKIDRLQKRVKELEAENEKLRERVGIVEENRPEARAQ